MTNRLLTASLCFTAAFALAGCSASETDCERWGEKYVELVVAKNASQGLPSDLVKMAAEADANVLITQCKAERPPKSFIRCALAAERLEDTEKCR